MSKRMWVAILLSIPLAGVLAQDVATDQRAIDLGHSEWIQRAIESPVREVVQGDGRIRRWGSVPEIGGKFLRVVLLPDGETVHNAFFDRGFKP